MKSIALTLVSITLLSTTAASTSWAAEQGLRSIDNASRARIVAAAVAAAGESDWQTADVKVEPDVVSGLNRNGCIFMVAFNRQIMDGILFHYALLPDGRIAGVDITGNAAAAAGLRLCGQQADATWWADIVARLSEAAGIAPVSDGFSAAFDNLRKAGLDVKPPTLVRSETATTVEFFARGFGTPNDNEFPLHIRATLPDQGELTVIVKNLEDQ